MRNSKLEGTLAELVQINSVNPAYLPGCSETEIQKVVANFFRARRIDAVSQEVCPGRPNVIAKVQGKNKERRLIFEAHVDTAGVEGMTIPPFNPEIKDGCMYGRGACDTKAGLAAMMHALADLKDSGITPASEIWVVATVDEEYSYKGVLKLTSGLWASGSVVSEPTEMRLAVASKGCLRWRITVRGKAAHSSNPRNGINAIAHMGRVLSSLELEGESLRAMRHPLVGTPTISVGLIRGGTQVNIVPDECWIEVDRRLIPGEEPTTVLHSYGALLDNLRVERPELEAVMEPPSLQDWSLETPTDSSIVEQTAAVLREVGLDPHPIGVPFGSDASKLSLAGVSSIILGPGSVKQAHTADEFVALDQVEKAFVVYRRLMQVFE